MLTSYQAEVIAFSDGYGEIICTDCAYDRFASEGGEAVQMFDPLSRYAMDEEQGWRGAVDPTDEEEAAEHVADCMCAYAIQCDSCAAILVEDYEDPDCRAKREEARDERDPALD